MDGSVGKHVQRADRKMQKRKGFAKSRCTSQQEAKKITACGERLALVLYIDLWVPPVDVEGFGDLCLLREFESVRGPSDQKHYPYSNLYQYVSVGRAKLRRSHGHSISSSPPQTVVD